MDDAVLPTFDKKCRLTPQSFHHGSSPSISWSLAPLLTFLKVPHHPQRLRWKDPLILKNNIPSIVRTERRWVRSFLLSLHLFRSHVSQLEYAFYFTTTGWRYQRPILPSQRQLQSLPRNPHDCSRRLDSTPTTSFMSSTDADLGMTGSFFGAGWFVTLCLGTIGTHWFFVQQY
jgi:hypothetical protein